MNMGTIDWAFGKIEDRDAFFERLKDHGLKNPLPINAYIEAVYYGDSAPICFPFGVVLNYEGEDFNEETNEIFDKWLRDLIPINAQHMGMGSGIYIKLNSARDKVFQFPLKQKPPNPYRCQCKTIEKIETCCVEAFYVFDKEELIPHIVVASFVERCGICKKKLGEGYGDVNEYETEAQAKEELQELDASIGKWF